MRAIWNGQGNRHSRDDPDRGPSQTRSRTSTSSTRNAPSPHTSLSPTPSGRIEYRNGRSWLHLSDRSRDSSLGRVAHGQDDVNAPTPVSVSPLSRPHLEDRPSAFGIVTEGQDEAVAPSPVSALSRDDRDYLEDATSSNTPLPASPAPAHVPAGTATYQHELLPSPAAPAETDPAAIESAVSGWSISSRARRRDEIVQLLQTNAWFIPFSIFGTLARLGLTALTTYNGAPLGGVIWANFAGCVVMGFLAEDRKLFSPRPSTPSSPLEGKTPPASTSSKATLPLYLGLTTGFCGSFTSFSSFLLIAFDELSNNSPAYTRPTKGYNFLAFVAYLIATIALSYAGLQFGAHTAVLLHPVLPSVIPRSVRARRFIDWAALPLGLGCLAGAVAMACTIPQWRGTALFACVFAPLGVWARFWVSRWFNPMVKSFPLGTFAVNVVGTLVLAGVIVGRAEHSGVGCQVLRGVQDGFCGCLTTVSTFIVEVRGLRSHHAYIYACTSIAVGMCFMILVLGSYTWDVGREPQKC